MLSGIRSFLREWRRVGSIPAEGSRRGWFSWLPDDLPARLSHSEIAVKHPSAIDRRSCRANPPGRPAAHILQHIGSPLSYPNNTHPTNRCRPHLHVPDYPPWPLHAHPPGYLFQPVPDAHTDSSPAKPTHPAPPALEVTQRLSDRRETDSCGFVLGRVAPCFGDPIG